MALNLCCCCSLQNGTRTIGVMQIIQGVLGVLLWIYTIIIFQSEYQRYGMAIGTMIALAIALFWNVSIIILGALILIGANERNCRKCRVWFYIMVVKAGLMILAAGLSASFVVSGSEVFIAIGAAILDIYMMCVVHSFVNEIESSPNLLMKPKDAAE